MMLIDTVSPDSFYNSGAHFLFFMLLTAHACVLIDISPWQKHPICQLNLLLASMISAAIPSIFVDLVSFSTPVIELVAGIGAALLLSLISTLTIQRFINIDVNY